MLGYAKVFYVWVDVGVTSSQFHDLGKVCNWGWDMLVAKACSFSGFPYIGHIGI